MTVIAHLLKAKGTDVYSVRPTDTVYAAIKMMAEKDVGSLLVLEGDELLGIFTERQYARDVMLKGRTSPSTFVREIMEPNAITVGPTATVETCMAVMTRERVRYLPVVANRRLLGVVSIGDLVKSIIDEQRFTIGQLEGYIHGERVHHWP
jgi:CBS domain-containing protein